MLRSEFVRWLDGLFELDRFAEPHGWDFALSARAMQELLRHASDRFARRFNGLLATERTDDTELTRVYLVVFPEQSLLDDILARERVRSSHGAIVVTHHPVDMETGRRGFIPIPWYQLFRLRKLDAPLYILHAPLDCHPTISTSRALAEGLGLTVEQTFAPYVGGDCGVIATGEACAFASFAERVRKLCELPFFLPDQVRFAGRPVERVAIVAGGGDDTGYLTQAQALDCDTYLAGHWWTPHAGEWCDQNRAALASLLPAITMNLLSASHDGSELVVFRDVLEPLIAGWGIETQLLRAADHWR